MKLRNLVQTMTLSILASAMLIGCGGGSDSAAPVDDIQTGTFIDAPVKGLYFKTATQQGYTNDSGEFSYKAGETVEFKLGNLSLGTVSAGALITPYTMAGDTNISNPSDKATNIAMLLQSFDGNRSDTSMLDVSKLQDANLSDINISVSVNDMTTKIASKFADNGFSQYRDITNNTPVDATTAKNNMKNFVSANSTKYDKKFTQEWLDQNILYYVENTDGDDNPVPLFIMSQKFRDGIFYGDDSPVYGGQARFENWGSYTITENGVIAITNEGQTKYMKINAVYADYIEIFGSEDGGKTFTLLGNYYTDKAKADSQIASVITGFGTEWVKNKTLYTVVNGNIYTFTFSNGKQQRVGLGLSNFNEDYWILEDGILKVDETIMNDGTETYDYVKILDIDGEKITLAEGEDLNTVRSSNVIGQYFFTTLSAAQDYKNSL